MTGDVVNTGGTANVALNNHSVLTGNIQLGTDSLLNLGLDRASMTGDVINSGGTANVALNNHSALTGNIQVGTASTLNLNLDRASMTGDVVNAGGTAQVTLNNHSVLTGRLENVDSLGVNSDATWVMTADQQLNDLSLRGGNVRFGESGQFYQLDVKNLSGNGTFVMSADFAHLKGDFLNVTGTSSGAHQLLIASSGADPLSEDRLHVAHTEDGGATFSLLGERVDVGTYSYRLIDENDGKDWLLDPKSKIISPGTRSVLALFNTAPTVWYGEMTSLRTRMGEVRFNPEQTGGWVRAYGNRFDVSSGGGYKQSQQGFTLGADMPIADSQWLVGVMAGHSNSQLDLTHGTSGTVKSYYLGAYATWLDEDGYYFDAVAKANRFQNESNVAVSDGSKVKGSYNNTGIGVSAEFGRKIKLKDDYFVEPYAQLSTVNIQGASYQLDNGLKANGESTRSILGKAGVTAGRDFLLEDGSVVQPYLRAAMVHEFANNSKVTVNNSNVFKNDLSGSRAEFGAGVAVKVSKNLQLHADFEHSQGKNIDQPWGANVGLRYNF
jgi:outer membrane autotransporter protein